MKYTQQNSSERVLVVKGLKADLIPGMQYEVEVTVESLGILRSRRKTFSKLETYYYCINDYKSYLPYTWTCMMATVHNFTGTNLHLIFNIITDIAWLCCLPIDTL